MAEALLPAVIIEPDTGPAEASIIWLHGLGVDGHDFAPIVPELGLGDLPLRFVFPHAPPRPVTINGGRMMPAWYDITALDLALGEDEAGTRVSEGRIRVLIARERERGIPSARIILAGFSQGGAVALHTALRYPEPLAGVLALSTYLPLAERVPGEADRANAGLPVFMGHGYDDPIIPFGRARRSRKSLEALGCAVEWHEYAMAHSVCPEEIRDMAAWLRRVLDLQGARGRETEVAPGPHGD